MKGRKTLKQLIYTLYNEDVFENFIKLPYMNCVGECKTNKTHGGRLSSSSPQSPHVKRIN